jgi:hypothetical protein
VVIADAHRRPGRIALLTGELPQSGGTDLQIVVERLQHLERRLRTS